MSLQEDRPAASPHPVEAPASYGQRMLWAMSRYISDRSALNVPVICRVEGPLEGTRWQAAVDRLVAENETLRTSLRTGRRLAQVVHPPAPVPLRRADLSQHADPERAVQDALATECGSPIDPTGSPVRATLWRLAEQEHVLCMNIHHVATDTTSSALLFARLVELAGGSPGPAPRAWTYREFAGRQNRRLAQGELEEQVAYWTRRLDGVRFPDLGAAGATDPGGRFTADLPGPLVERLTGLARARASTPFGVLLAVFYAVLHALTGERDLALASVFANRTRPETSATVGFLANLLVLRTRVPRGGTFADLLRAVHGTVTEAVVHQEVPYHLVPREHGPSGSARADEVVFQLITDRVHARAAGPVRVTALVPEAVGPRFGLELGLVPVGDGLRAVLLAAPDRLPAGFPQAVLSRYLAVASVVAAAPDTPLAALRG